MRVKEKAAYKRYDGENEGRFKGVNIIFVRREKGLVLEETVHNALVILPYRKMDLYCKLVKRKFNSL